MPQEKREVPKSEVPIVVIFDTETTGIEKEDRIIQVGAIIEDLDGNLIEKGVYNELCSSAEPIKIEAMSVHGIRQDRLKGKLPFTKSAFFAKLNTLNTEANYLIAHNLDFDFDMLKKEGFENRMQRIDTLQCAKHLFEVGDEVNGYKVPNHKLQSFRYMMFSQEEEEAAARKYGVEIRAHDAIGDVVILKLFFEQLKERAAAKFQLKNSGEVMDKLVELTKLPVEVKVINFGKHKGKTIAEIEKIDAGWITWLHREQKKQKESQDPKFNKDLFYTLEKVIQRRSGVRS
jgi:DNA polymerase-3 subunit epsilon/exodeoxyribonuclease X